MNRFITMVNGEFHKKVQKESQPQDVIVREIPHATNSARNWFEGELIACAQRESESLRDDDSLILVEADVRFDSGVEIPLNRITVEKSDISYIAGVPASVLPFPGFVSCPQRYAKIFFSSWLASWKDTRSNLISLYYTLKKLRFPYEIRQDTGFWPNRHPITHFRGLAAKETLL
jgi:hypothetical protein